MASKTPFLPKIYVLIPGLAGSQTTLKEHIKRCADLAFDHVLLPAAGGPLTVLDEQTKLCADLCRKNRLALMLDLDIDKFAEDPETTDAHPDWFAAPDGGDDLPDPRRPPGKKTRALRYGNREVESSVISHVMQQLEKAVELGIVGFRCLGLPREASPLWAALIAQAKAKWPHARFLAWTPGCTAETLAALSQCGFDATFSSNAWWNYRADWLAEENSRLTAVAPPIALPDNPADSVLRRIEGYDDPQVRRNIFRRALRLSAAIGNGILLPMGFEHGFASESREVDPEEFRRFLSNAPFDLSEEVREANAFISKQGKTLYGAELRLLGGERGDAAVLLRAPADPGIRDNALVVAVNASLTAEAPIEGRQLLEHGDGYVPCEPVWNDGASDADSSALMTLRPGELQSFLASHLRPITLPPSRGKAAVTAAAKAPRIAIEAISPMVDAGRFSAKRTVGEVIDVEADVFMDGHDKLAVVLLWRAADEAEWSTTRMHALGNDRWTAPMPLTRVGRYLFAVEAWRDEFATYRDELQKKSDAGLDVSLELEEGRLKVESALAYAQENGLDEAASALKAFSKSLKAARSRDKAAEKNAERVALLLSEPMLEAMRLADARPFAVRSETLRVDADRASARFSSWYELFPRSQSGDAKRHGTFDDVIRRLPAIQAMGFDTLYFPPIHPIGLKNRKGRNNTLTPGPDDPGSPYAIGAKEGGHDAVHPQLGTIEDFRRLRDEAAKHGLELALDFAIQCSPDHPWLKEHPEWFDWRPDGSIRYAENPPKKYQDIVNVDFYAEGAVPGLWNALRDVVLFWAKEGVRVFRVDNPHTKTLPFWEWMINDIKSRYPDTIFLSEAFTRPKMMYRLAKLGFSQSYTYFTWRHTKAEFIDYMTELTNEPVCNFFRPHFFVNTPDINPPFLQQSGRPGHLIRAALATTLSGLWGMYSGFELCEATPVPGKEEYLDSEKYEIRAWDWNRPGNIIREITQLNRIRKNNPALQSHLGIRFLPSSSDHVLVFLKTTRPVDEARVFGDNVILVAVNLDPLHARETSIELPLRELGAADEASIEVTDLVSGNIAVWHGKTQHLRLDPSVLPYAIWRIGQPLPGA